jgi:hypothetical protein
MDADYWIYAAAGMDTVGGRTFINTCLQTPTRDGHDARVHIGTPPTPQGATDSPELAAGPRRGYDPDKANKTCEQERVRRSIHG